MLSQRMAKAYFQIGQQVEVDRSKKVLDASVAAFDRQLVELKNFAPTPEIKDNYVKLEKSWLDYKDLLVGAAAIAGQRARRCSNSPNRCLRLAHQGTQQLEKRSSSSAGRLVNLSGRQRMLSQRMAKFYQANAWGIGNDKSHRRTGKGQKGVRRRPSGTRRGAGQYAADQGKPGSGQAAVDLLRAARWVRRPAPTSARRQRWRRPASASSKKWKPSSASTRS